MLYAYLTFTEPCSLCLKLKTTTEQCHCDKLDVTASMYSLHQYIAPPSPTAENQRNINRINRQKQSFWQTVWSMMKMNGFSLSLPDDTSYLCNQTAEIFCANIHIMFATRSIETVSIFVKFHLSGQFPGYFSMFFHSKLWPNSPFFV